jgi:GT2 family glycosyltransferase
VNAPTLSVIIVSQGRPEHLVLCLTAISQLRRATFEVVVVADAPGLAALTGAHPALPIKTIRFDQPNISQARNLGIAAAAGQVVAFVDDDSTPEPGWLYHLARAFADAALDAACGYVRGRNGISYQVRGQTIDCYATVATIPISGYKAQVLDPPRGAAISTIGTNCAFRRDVLAGIGGFDPSFDYFLDESDLNMRLALAGRKTAIVPMAQVHHRRAASSRRQRSGAPRTLFHIGRSTAIFLRKYAPEPERGLKLAMDRQRRSLMARMTAGTLAPHEVQTLLSTLRDGFDAGQKTRMQPVPAIARPNTPFLPFRSNRAAANHIVLSGYRINAARLRKRAAQGVRDGHLVSLYVFSRTALRPRIRFHPDGYWEHRGGLFAASPHSHRRFSALPLRKRTALEAQNVLMLRHPWDMIDSADDGADISG